MTGPGAAPSPPSADPFAVSLALRVGFWASSALFVLVGLTVLVRLTTSQRTMDPAFKLGPRLEILLNHNATLDLLGLEPGYRLRAVGGAAVADRPSYRAAVRASSGRSVVVSVDRPGDPLSAHRIRFIRHPVSPRFEFGESMSIVSVQGEDPAAWGLAEGDRVVAVGGEAVSSPADLERIVADHHDLLIRYSIVPSPESGEPFDYIVWFVRWDVAWVLFCAGLAFGALGFAAFWLKPHTYSSWGFLTFCLAMGVFHFLRSVPSTIRLEREFWLFSAMQCLLPLPTIFFVATFTPLRLLIPRFRPILIAAGVYGIALFVLNQIVHPASPNLRPPAFHFWALTMAALLILSLPVDTWFRLRGRRLGATDRQRAIAIRLATLAAFAPVTGYTIFRILTGLGASVQVWIELGVLLFPLIIAYAIARHNLLQVSELVVQGALFLVTLLGVALAYSVLVALVSTAVEAVAPVNASTVRTILLGGIVFVAAPLHVRLHRAVERRFDRTTIATLSAATTLEDAAADLSNPSDFCSFAVRELSHASSDSTVAFFVRHPPSDRWWLAATAEAAPRGATTAQCQPLFDWLAAQRGELSRDELIDDLRFSRFRGPMLAAMQSLGASFVFPLRVCDELWGAIALGDKRDLTNYTAGEMKVIRRMVRQSGLELYSTIQRSAQGRPVAADGRRIVDLYPRCPTRIGAYAIDGILGEGGMAYVYRGWSERGWLAIKVANAEVQANGRLMQRFHREAVAMQRLEHPNIVPIFEVGRLGPEPFIVMEYFSEGTLHQRLKREGPLDEAEALTLATDVARALEAALARGVVHRDVKPKNILLTLSGQAKIGDFGLARVEDASTLSLTGEMKGTPAYLSPEQCQGERGDWRGDQYALGVSLFELLTGRRPFESTTIGALVYQHVHAAAPDVRSLTEKVGAATAAIVDRMLAKDPEERFGSYSELIAALEKAARP